MPTEPRLEQYLSLLDRALGQIPVGDRSDIITEIKSHVLEAKERDPEKDLNGILAAIGEPENVANRYLIERGIKPGRPSRSPIVKWLTIGFLGTVAIVALLIGGLIWKFTPLLKVDEKAGRVVLLGGLIDISENEGLLHIGGTTIHSDDHAQVFEGSTTIDASKFDSIAVSFSNAKIETTSAHGSEFRWKCKFSGGKDAATITAEKRVFEMNLLKTSGAKCELQLPEKIPAKLSGANGKIEIAKPHAAIEAKLDNGLIGFTADSERHYRYDVKVSTGMSDAFESSNAKDAIDIKLHLTNGKIKRD